MQALTVTCNRHGDLTPEEVLSFLAATAKRTPSYTVHAPYWKEAVLQAAYLFFFLALKFLFRDFV